MKPPRNAGRTLAGLAMALIALFVMLRWFEHKQVYYPTRQFDADASELGRPFEEVQFRAVDGTELHGWFFPADTGSARQNLAVLICHGNGGNISHRLDLYELLLGRGVNVFAFDYRGYGRSKGRPGEEGTYLDALAAHEWLQGKGFPPGHIIAYGESLGGGVATELALRQRVGGLVLQSTFTSIADLGKELFPWLPVRWINTIKYDTRSKLPKVHAPVLVMHSRADRLIGFHHAEANFAAANEPKLFWEIQGDHNEALSDAEGFARGIEKLLELVETGGVTEGAGMPR